MPHIKEVLEFVGRGLGILLLFDSVCENGLGNLILNLLNLAWGEGISWSWIITCLCCVD